MGDRRPTSLWPRLSLTPTSNITTKGRGNANASAVHRTALSFRALRFVLAFLRLSSIGGARRESLRRPPAQSAGGHEPIHAVNHCHGRAIPLSAHLRNLQEKEKKRETHPSFDARLKRMPAAPSRSASRTSATSLWRPSEHLKLEQGHDAPFIKPSMAMSTLTSI